MPTGQRGSIGQVADEFIRIASECTDNKVHYKVTIHALTSYGKVLEKGIEHGAYTLTAEAEEPETPDAG